MPRIRPPIERDTRLGLQHALDPVILAEGRVAGRGGLARGGFARGHEQAERLGGGRQGEFGGDDLEEFGDAGACVTEEFDAGFFPGGVGGGEERRRRRGVVGRRGPWEEMETHVLSAYLEDQLEWFLIYKGTGVVDPATSRRRRRRRSGSSGSSGRVSARWWWWSGIGQDADARLEDVLEAEDDFLAATGLVEADGVGDQALLEALEVEVATVAQQAGAVLVVADVDGVAAQQVQQLCKGVGGAARDAGGQDGGGADQTLAG